MQETSKYTVFNIREYLGNVSHGLGEDTLKADYMSVREKPLRILRINFLPMLLIWLYRH